MSNFKIGPADAYEKQEPMITISTEGIDKIYTDIFIGIKDGKLEVTAIKVDGVISTIGISFSQK